MKTANKRLCSKATPMNPVNSSNTKTYPHTSVSTTLSTDHLQTRSQLKPVQDSDPAAKIKVNLDNFYRFSFTLIFIGNTLVQKIVLPFCFSLKPACYVTSNFISAIYIIWKQTTFLPAPSDCLVTRPTLLEALTLLERLATNKAIKHANAWEQLANCIAIHTHKRPYSDINVNQRIPADNNRLVLQH